MKEITYKIDGIDYKFQSGFGVQLTSKERIKVKVGDTRVIHNHLFYVYNFTKLGLFGKKEIGWCLHKNGDRLNLEDIRDFEKVLKNGGH